MTKIVFEIAEVFSTVPCNLVRIFTYFCSQKIFKHICGVRIVGNFFPPLLLLMWCHVTNVWLVLEAVWLRSTKYLPKSWQNPRRRPCCLWFAYPTTSCVEVVAFFDLDVGLLMGSDLD